MQRKEHYHFCKLDCIRKKQLGIGNLYFADKTYNVHKAVDDVVAMERLFTSTLLVSLLSTLTMWNMQINTGMEI